MSWQTKRFGKLTILKEVAPDIFLCGCDCGNKVELFRSVLDNGVKRHCGCVQRGSHRSEPTAHYRCYKTRSGKKKLKTSAEYNSWWAMNNRCHCKGYNSYEGYGARGIVVCERWRRGFGERGQSFKNFLADMGPRPSGMTLDRINPNGHYEPSNCRWATAKVQAENKGCIIWKHVDPPDVEAAAEMEKRIQEEYDEAHPY